MNQKGFALIPAVLIFAAFILISAVSFLFGQKSLDSKNIKIDLTDLDNPIATPTPDPIELKNNYSSDKYNYSFKYPSEAKLNENDATGKYLGISFMGQKQIDSGRTQTELFDGYGFGVLVMELDQSKNIDQIAAENLTRNTSSCPNPQGEAEIKKGMISGYESRNFELSCMGDYTLHYVSDGNNLFELSELYVGEESDRLVYKSITAKIVAGFKLEK